MDFLQLRLKRPGLRGAAFGALAVALLVGPWCVAQGQVPKPPKPPIRTKDLPTPRTAGTAHQDCMTSCHATHRSSTPGEVLLKTKTVDDLCMSCHTGQSPQRAPGQAKQIGVLQGVASAHVMTPDAGHTGTYMRVVVADGRRQIFRDTCTGCHDAHSKEPGKPRDVAFDARGNWKGKNPQHTAPICFACHAGPQAARGKRRDDIGALFQQGVPSVHAIGATARDHSNLPSLRGSPFKGELDCTECHNSPDWTGPHASPNDYLLAAGYGREGDGTAGPRSNELCYMCHVQTSIEGNESFAYHGAHIAGWTGQAALPSMRLSGPDAKIFEKAFKEMPPLGKKRGLGQKHLMEGYGQPTPCATCHAAHGSPTNPMLIDFDGAVVSPSSIGGPTFQWQGPNHGTCTLTCHGYDHKQVSY